MKFDFRLSCIIFSSIIFYQCICSAASKTALVLPPADAPGYPSRDVNLDVLPGFQEPPAGYGEVPFWWWTGEKLDKDRLLWQIDQLHKKGIAGMQVNYAHQDTSGWQTYPAEPEIFTEQWWEVWKFVAAECKKRGMGIGLSGYTIDWPNGTSLVSRTIYSDPEIQGREINVDSKTPVKADQTVSIKIPQGAIGVHAYPIRNNSIESGGIDLTSIVKNGQLEWKASDGDFEIWVFTANRKAGTLNPMHPQAGKRVIEQFFQRFQDNTPDKTAGGLNYFFHDELQFGVSDYIWTDDFREEFHRQKGYDVFDVLPALFTDIGAVTPKACMDFMDVKIQLAEQRYFEPIFNWHLSRGKIYGCDNMGRGREPQAYGDYFRSVRWYTAPGHDTPGGHADLIKGKVSSSIAQLYKLPRVWLEGYHSFGWGAFPEQLMVATRENYLYGCTLLNLHGLYYTTYGSYWEWAPPCYHFRMPYWDHMDLFLKYFERLSYLLSQGVHQCDIAVLYPVSSYHAKMDGQKATDTAFTAGETLFRNGYDFIFIDDQSIDRAVIQDGKLAISDAAYKVLILPSIEAVRWSTLEKARAFYAAGGIVIAIDELPQASDRAGRNDPLLDETIKTIFSLTAAEAKANNSVVRQENKAGGVGLIVKKAEQVVPEVGSLISRAVESEKPVRSMHRKIGSRDVFMVMDAAKGAECTFRAKGTAQIWDPWTGRAEPVSVVKETEAGTTVKMPLEQYEARIIVFSPGKSQSAEAYLEMETAATISIPNEEWELELKPTMDNRWGDFRLPITEQIIGAEARIFSYAEETKANPGWERRDFDDSTWQHVTYGFGPKFWKLGPLPENSDAAELDARLAMLKQVDPSIAVEVGGKSYSWTPYDFSWRWGKEGDPGHQGWHGLKENTSDDFICLGKAEQGHRETLYVEEDGGKRYYLWTSAVADKDMTARMLMGGTKPATVYVNGSGIQTDAEVRLNKGGNGLLLRYDTFGRGHFVLEESNAPQIKERTPLAMQWYDRPGVIALDVFAGMETQAGWYRFMAPPGLRGMKIAAIGDVQVWVDDQPVEITQAGNTNKGASEYLLKLPKSIPSMAKVAMRIEHPRGTAGGSAIPEPVILDCGVGQTALGDWSQGSVLESYSGGAWYRKTVELNADQIKGKVLLHLGDVVATAEVHVNGKKAGVRVAPPWTVDMTDCVRAGENRIEILVYNTLANHYLTIPTRYRGSLRSGLIGPVTIESQVPKNR
ncbi:MAG: glycosyl hydrolase [Anaerohalosphaeraceae bacterium]